MQQFVGGRSARAARRVAARKERHARPRLESLEDRWLLSITDMTGVASLFPRHAGPTVLYLNFDGYTAQGVSSFQSTTGNRDRDIQEILYRTSEIFAPFDVEVRRTFGNGNYDSSSNGNSTIFIGDKSSNGTGASNSAYAGTPWSFVDYPGDVKGITHQPNSDSYDLAYVDPVYGATSLSWSNTQIAQAVAHEAGHTFGLAHVLSSPDPEIMSYDAANTRFINKTFNVTDLNNNGSSTTHDPGHAPKWYVHIPFPFGGGFDFPIPITTQNSYTYLQTALGARSTAGDFANVADSSTVDPTYVDGFMPSLGVGSSMTASMQRFGDYDVYQLRSPVTRQVVIDVNALAGSNLDSVLMIYNQNGQSLLAYNDDRSLFNRNSEVTFTLQAGQTYKVVVGGWSDNTTGSYQLTVNASLPWILRSPLVDTSTLKLALNSSPLPRFAQADALPGQAPYFLPISLSTLTPSTVKYETPAVKTGMELKGPTANSVDLLSRPAGQVFTTVKASDFGSASARTMSVAGTDPSSVDWQPLQKALA